MHVVSDVNPAAWDAFVSAHPDATAYHQWAWRGVFERAFGHETLYLAALEDGGIAGVLPLVLFRSRVFGRFAVSLPFVNYGGICATSSVAAGLLEDAARTAALRLDLAHVELRHLARQRPALPAREHKVTMLLPLASDATAQWSRVDRKARNQVRKAEGSGLTVRSGGAELLDTFYSVFARNMRDLGTPVYSRRFFREVLDTFPDAVRVFIVDAGGVPAAGAITLRHRDTVQVPWASSLREYLAQCPNNLLYWRIIEDAIAAGAATLDFGRSTAGEGTFRFKQQWGAMPHPLYWEYALLGGATLPDFSAKNPRFERAVAVWKRLPIGVTNRLGPHIVRSIP